MKNLIKPKSNQMMIGLRKISGKTMILRKYLYNNKYYEGHDSWAWDTGINDFRYTLNNYEIDEW